MNNIEGRLLGVIERCRGYGVPGAELDDMAALARAGEFGVALENLCTQLFEYDCLVDPGVLEEIAALGTAMGISEKYWKRLQAS